MKVAIIKAPNSAPVVFAQRLCEDNETGEAVMREHFDNVARPTETTVEFENVPRGCENRVIERIKSTRITPWGMRSFIRELREEQRL